MLYHLRTFPDDREWRAHTVIVAPVPKQKGSNKADDTALPERGQHPSCQAGFRMQLLEGQEHCCLVCALT